MIALNNLVAGYRRRAVTPTLAGAFAGGSMTALVGDNGSGKSTLLKTLCGIIPPVSGEITFPRPRPSLAWMPQHAEIEKSFPITVFELAAMGLWRQCGWFRGINRQQRGRIMQVLERVGMLAYAGVPPDTLSGGQLQRVLFARLMLQDADLLLLDEPFSNVDSETTLLLIELLKERQRSGCTLIVVMHDTHIVREHFAQTLRLGKQRAEWSYCAARNVDCVTSLGMEETL